MSLLEPLFVSKSLGAYSSLDGIEPTRKRRMLKGADWYSKAALQRTKRHTERSWSVGMLTAVVLVDTTRAPVSSATVERKTGLACSSAFASTISYAGQSCENSSSSSNSGCFRIR